MNTKEINTKKICSFYANDVHLGIMILPFIDKKLEQNQKIYIVNETNLENNISNVIKKMNLKNEKKQSILSLEWNNNKNEIDKINKEKSNATIFIIGSQKFNDENNIKIKEKQNLEIINCYNIDEISDSTQLKNKHDKILNSMGVKEFA